MHKPEILNKQTVVQSEAKIILNSATLWAVWESLAITDNYHTPFLANSKTTHISNFTMQNSSNNLKLMSHLKMF